MSSGDGPALCGVLEAPVTSVVPVLPPLLFPDSSVCFLGHSELNIRNTRSLCSESSELETKVLAGETLSWVSFPAPGVQ